MSALPVAPTTWKVVRLLLAASYRRAAGRRRRQRELFAHRAAKRTNFSQLGFVVVAVMLAFVHLMSAFLLTRAVTAGEAAAAERRGWVVVDRWFIDAVSDTTRTTDRAYRIEAERSARRNGGDPQTIEAHLRQTVRSQGTARLMSRGRAAPGLVGLPGAGSLAALLGSLTLLIWFVMMAFQGEGLELDTRRRRYPMWEWLFSHPVSPSAVFLAEMLAPIAANPIYLSAPLLPGIPFGVLYGKAAGTLAAMVIGVPVTLAAACFGKALEIGVTLRFTPRSRGAMIGLMGWLGYATILGIFLAFVTQGKLFTMAAGPLAPLANLPWPYIGLFLGLLPNGRFSLPFGVLIDLLFSAAVIAG